MIVGLKRWLLRACLLALIIVISYEATFMWRIYALRHSPPERTAFMQAYVDEQKGQPVYRWVNYDQISIHLKRAVVASEDARFLSHHGFDWQAIKSAATTNLRKGKTVSGGSTITQQLAKNLYLSPKRSFLRKIQEVIVALMLESTLSKRRILEIYLNVIEWGTGIYGASSAARHYFGLTAASLTETQAAKLAAYIPSPRLYAQRGDTDYSMRKMAIIRGRMLQARIPE